MEDLDKRLQRTYLRGCESLGNILDMLMESGGYETRSEGTEQIREEKAILKGAAHELESLALGSREYADLLGKRQAITQAIAEARKGPGMFGIYLLWMDKECDLQRAASAGRY